MRTSNRIPRHSVASAIAVISAISFAGCVTGAALSADDANVGNTVYLVSSGVISSSTLEISDGTVLRAGEEGQIIRRGETQLPGGGSFTYPFVIVEFRKNVRIVFAQGNFGTFFKEFRLVSTAQPEVGGTFFDFTGYKAWKVQTSP